MFTHLPLINFFWRCRSFDPRTHHHSSRAPGHLKLTGEMSDPNTVKILIAGDVRGNLPALYTLV